MPLKALEEEPCEKLKTITDCKPFVLNGDSNNDYNLQMIREGKFSHGVPVSFVNIMEHRVINIHSVHKSRDSHLEVIQRSSLAAF